MGNFVHLHVHSEFSLLDGAARIENIVKKCKEYNMPAVAITDHGVMYSAICTHQLLCLTHVREVVSNLFLVASFMLLMTLMINMARVKIAT